MSLPQSWVDRIFEKLTLVYGRAFLDRWRDIDLNAVKTDWAHELASMQQHPHMIAYALEHLPPGDPPTVLQFRDLARKMPPEKVSLLRAPEVDRDKVRKLIEQARAKLTRSAA